MVAKRDYSLVMEKALRDIFPYLERSEFENLLKGLPRPRVLEHLVEHDFKRRHEGETGERLSLPEAADLYRDDVEDEVHRLSKKMIEGYDERQRILNVMRTLGKSREEIITNLGHLVMSSPTLLDEYQTLIGEKATHRRKEKFSLKFELEYIDSKYLNIFGLNN